MVGRLTRPELVVVTGAGSGIGRATAEAFAKDGATAICADIDLAAATETVLRITQHGGCAEAYQLDVADPDAFERFAGSVAESHGVPDVVVNNAGIGMGGPFLEHSVEDLRRIVDVNLLGVAYGCRLFGRQLAERHKAQPDRRGHIVNIASAAAYTPSRALPAYVMTKAAVLMLSEALRAELGDHNVGVSAICPGFIATNIYAATKFAGLDATAEKDRGGLIQDVFGRIAPGPELVAQRIRLAVRFDIPVLPVTIGSWLAYGTFHYAMPLMRRLASLDLDAQLPRLDRLTRRLRSARPDTLPAPDDDPARSPRA